MIESANDYTVIPSESFLEPRMYRVRWACPECDHRWSKTLKSIPKNDPPCPSPRCVDARRIREQDAKIDNLTQMLRQQSAPARIGANVTVKAVDATANIVMEDYGMTNLRDGVRVGESVAPKLDNPNSQKLADNYFGPQGSMPVITAPGERRMMMNAKQMSVLGRRALSGAYRGMAVPPNAVTPDAVKGQPALTRVRVEAPQQRR